MYAVVCTSGWITRRLSTHSTSYVVVVSIFLALLALTGRYLVTKRVVDCKTCFSNRGLSNNYSKSSGGWCHSVIYETPRSHIS